MDTMTLQRFRELAAAWGADVTRWPAAAQPGAVRVLGGSDGDAARRILGQAGELDVALHAGAPVPVPAALRAAILATAEEAMAAAKATPEAADEETLSYAAEWFPRPQAIAGGDGTAPLRRPTGAAARAADAGGWARLWSELGGLRMAGPALAMAVVLGVTLAEVRGGAAPDAGADATPAVSGEEVMDVALFGADYEEYTL